MRRLVAGTLIAAGTATLLSCAGPPREILEAASLEEAQALAARHSGLIAMEFWSEG